MPDNDRAEYVSLEGLISDLKQLQAEGYTTIPIEYPLEGGVGAIAWKDIEVEGEAVEKSVSLIFHPFGKMTTLAENTSPQEFVEYLFRDGTFVCDDPRTLRLGAVRYDTQSLTAHVRYLPLSSFKRSNLPPDVKTRMCTTQGRGVPPFEFEKQKIEEALAR